MMHTINEQALSAADTRDYASVSVRRACSGDKARLVATLISAFINDPTVRWLYPEADNYLQSYPSFAQAFGGGAFDLGTTWRSQDFSACALWYPPGSGPDDEAFSAVIEKTIPSERHEEVFALFETLGKVHPTSPHWYLSLTGVDAGKQGRGLGSALLRVMLAQCDRDGVPAYLESSNPRNIPLYERHGFQRREAVLVGRCPPIVPMWREPLPAI